MTTERQQHYLWHGGYYVALAQRKSCSHVDVETSAACQRVGLVSASGVVKPWTWSPTYLRHAPRPRLFTHGLPIASVCNDRGSDGGGRTDLFRSAKSRWNWPPALAESILSAINRSIHSPRSRHPHRRRPRELAPIPCHRPPPSFRNESRAVRSLPLLG